MVAVTTVEAPANAIIVRICSRGPRGERGRSLSRAESVTMEVTRLREETLFVNDVEGERSFGRSNHASKFLSHSPSNFPYHIRHLAWPGLA